MNENWTEDFERRKAKEAEVEKRTLAFQESYENGDITEADYQMSVEAEYAHSEPSIDWVPIEDPLNPIQDVPVDTLAKEYQKIQDTEAANSNDLEVFEELIELHDQNEIDE